MNKKVLKNKKSFFVTEHQVVKRMAELVRIYLTKTRSLV